MRVREYARAQEPKSARARMFKCAIGQVRKSASARVRKMERAQVCKCAKAQSSSASWAAEVHQPLGSPASARRHGQPSESSLVLSRAVTTEALAAHLAGKPTTHVTGLTDSGADVRRGRGVPCPRPVSRAAVHWPAVPGGRGPGDELAIRANTAGPAARVASAHVHEMFPAAWLVLLAASAAAAAAAACQGCGARRAALAGEQLAAARVELIKRQILDKLRLQEPPRPRAPPPQLPAPLAGGGPAPPPQGDGDADAFYGRTDQVILLPKEEVPHWSNEGSELSRKIFDSRESYTEDGWIKLKMTRIVKDWLHYQERSHKIHIECTTCSRESNQTAMFTDEKHKTVLAVHVNATKKNHRVKRNINCSPGVSECCREELYVSFAEIGWGDWILQPQGYHAYFCRGSCSNAPALTVTGSYYTTIIQKLIHRNHQLNRDIDLSPCCTATRLSSIQLLYMDGNETITQKTLPNMVVDSCGCM
ncbi:uncharacterized protein LOC134528936 [Bacillus rossius redtenbacheri]|uniref:uncharacterized protein LOC134528936 n=1 Tax=Bacillus rossius redtenbacheri TaxID=93214 RepID=UPI002FDE2B2B